MYKKILVPIDGSGKAETILSHVTDLAKCSGATIVLLQVVEAEIQGGARPFSELSRHKEELTRLTDQAATYLMTVKEKLQPSGIEVMTRVVYGPVARGILKAAEDEKADLIAIASHGRGGLSRVFYGSVASALLQLVDRPLLIIRSRANTQTPAKNPL